MTYGIPGSRIGPVLVFGPLGLAPRMAGSRPTLCRHSPRPYAYHLLHRCQVVLFIYHPGIRILGSRDLGMSDPGPYLVYHFWPDSGSIPMVLGEDPGPQTGPRLATPTVGTACQTSHLSCQTQGLSASGPSLVLVGHQIRGSSGSGVQEFNVNGLLGSGVYGHPGTGLTCIL